MKVTVGDSAPTGGGYHIPVNGARFAGANCLGVVLPEMGNDDAGGMLVMKKAGVFNLIQEEVLCLAFSMPRK